jgi:EpsI family protein
VIFLLMTIGTIWSEAPGSAEAEHRRVSRHIGLSLSRTSLLGAVLAGLLAIHLWPFLAAKASAPVSHPPLQISATAKLLDASWIPSERPVQDWQPHFVGTPTVYERAFKADEHTVAVYVAWYAQQTQGEELINAANQLVREKDEPWRFLSASTQPTSMHANSPVLETILKQRGGEQQILVWQSNWVNGRFTMNKLATKLLEIKSRLSGHGNPAAAVIFYTPMAPDETPIEARKRLSKIMQGATPVLQDAFAKAAQ